MLLSYWGERDDSRRTRNIVSEGPRGLHRSKRRERERGREREREKFQLLHFQIHSERAQVVLETCAEVGVCRADMTPPAASSSTLRQAPKTKTHFAGILEVKPKVARIISGLRGTETKSAVGDVRASPKSAW